MSDQRVRVTGISGIVAMVVHEGRLIVATDDGLYQVIGSQMHRMELLAEPVVVESERFAVAETRRRVPPDPLLPERKA
jgi:hypothetical protein